MENDFILDIAADLYGCKENLEVRFPQRPSLGELQAKAESLYQIEATVQRPPGEPIQHVRIRRFQVYDDYQRRWLNLETADQLQPYAQLYAFQDTNVDYQADIPPSSPPRTRISVPAASPQRARNMGSPPTLHDIRAEVQRSPNAQDRIREAEGMCRMEPIPGESLIAAERSAEETKVEMDIDMHRELIRRETQQFLGR
eukprot:TRINITY_DN3624_c0_g3_i1.p1 TRINITY_DN3624_c0_g3~~TRINITY_DN3624_c0_g3_i1.p1  ORF type:complete len:199 (+),score=43.79 TRINITY_DN3624_c0_g3_i1:84-680(+)